MWESENNQVCITDFFSQKCSRLVCAVRISVIPPYLFESILILTSYVSAIPLGEDKEALVPQHGQHARFFGERHEVVHQRIDYLWWR